VIFGEVSLQWDVEWRVPAVGNKPDRVCSLIALRADLERASGSIPAAAARTGISILRYRETPDREGIEYS